MQTFVDLFTEKESFSLFRRSRGITFKGESHIDFRMQSVIMTLGGEDVGKLSLMTLAGEGGGAITNDVLKFRNCHELSMNCVLIY